LRTNQLWAGLDCVAKVSICYVLLAILIRIYGDTGDPVYGDGWCKSGAEVGCGLYAGLFVYVIVTYIGCQSVKISVCLPFFQRSCHICIRLIGCCLVGGLWLIRSLLFLLFWCFWFYLDITYLFVFLLSLSYSLLLLYYFLLFIW
jgi:hypothetical protein